MASPARLMGVKQSQKQSHRLHHPQSGRLHVDAMSLTSGEGSVAAKFEYKAYSNLAAGKIESLYIRIYMVILWPNIEYRATK